MCKWGMKCASARLFKSEVWVIIIISYIVFCITLLLLYLWQGIDAIYYHVASC